MVLIKKVNELIICNQEKEKGKRNERMELAMRVIIKTERNMDQIVYINFQMAPLIMETSKITLSMEQEPINLQMGMYTLGRGVKIRFMEKEYLLGLIIKNILESTGTIRSMERGFCIMQMGWCIMGNGSLVKGMEKVHKQIKTES